MAVELSTIASGSKGSKEYRKAARDTLVKIAKLVEEKAAKAQTESSESASSTDSKEAKAEKKAAMRAAKNKKVEVEVKKNNKAINNLSVLSDAVNQLTSGKNSFTKKDIANFLYSRSSKGKEDGEKYKTFLYEHYKKPFLSGDGKGKTKLNRAFKSNIDFIEELVNIQRNLKVIFDRYSNEIGLKVGNTHKLDKDILKTISHWISLRLGASRNYYRAQGIRAPSSVKSSFSGKFPTILTEQGKAWIRSENFDAPRYSKLSKKYKAAGVDTERVELSGESLLMTKGYTTVLAIRSLVEIALQGRKGPSAAEITRLSNNGEDVQVYWELTSEMTKVVNNNDDLKKRLKAKGSYKLNGLYRFTEQGQKITFAAALTYKKRDIIGNDFSDEDLAFVAAKKEGKPTELQKLMLDETMAIRLYSKGVTDVMSKTENVKKAANAQKAAGDAKKKRERVARNAKKDLQTGRDRK
jgi:hypothetical protein